jgi:hypothetical protein
LYGYCRRRNKDLIIAWIDCHRAFDSVPHSWREKSIEMSGIWTILSYINGEMEHKDSCKNKTGSNSDETRSDTKRSIPEELPSAITHVYSTYSINKQAEQT